jgi:hypothetical protein
METAESSDEKRPVQGVVMPVSCWTWQNSSGPGRAYMKKSADGAWCRREDVAQLVKELDYFRSAFLGLTPDFVPSRVRLLVTVCGDGPFRSTRAAAGEHPCTSNRYGAISVAAENGKLLGVKPHEFVPVEWIKNPQATFSPDEVRCKCLSTGPDYCPVHAA